MKAERVYHWNTSHYFLVDCTGGGVPCQIPYVYQGRMHFECTTEAPGGGGDLFGRFVVSSDPEEFK